MKKATTENKDKKADILGILTNTSINLSPFKTAFMKWTVLFVIHGLGPGLEEQSGILTRAVGYGRWKLNQANFLYLKSEMNESIITSTLYKANSLKERRSGEPDITRLRSFKNINIGNRYRLTRIFSYVRQHFPSDKLMIVFFDHGAGFGIFEAIPEKYYYDRTPGKEELVENLAGGIRKKPRTIFVPPASSFPRKRSSASSKDPEHLGAYRGKNSKTDMLTMEELSVAIKRGFRKKVDIMVLVNCNMQMIDTGYSLRKNVDYLVASETLFYIYGINYREVLFRIDAIRNINPEYIARQCIQTLSFRYERIKKEKKLSDVYFSAIHLPSMWPVYKELDKLAGKLLANLSSDMKMIRKARNAGIELSQYKFTKAKKDEYEPSLLYDLIFFLKSLGKYSTEVNKIESLINKAIIARQPGSEFKRRNGDMVNGLSVFLPLTFDDFEMQYYDLFYKQGAKFRVDFARTNWGKLLAAIKKQAEQ